MVNQTDATLQEVSQVRSTEAIKLLPWCVSMGVCLHYISEVPSIVIHQGKGISIASESSPAAPEPEPYGLPVPGPSGGLTHPPAVSPLPVFSIPDIPFGQYSLVRTFSCWPNHSSKGKVGPHSQ